MKNETDQRNPENSFKPRQLPALILKPLAAIDHLWLRVRKLKNSKMCPSQISAGAGVQSQSRIPVYHIEGIYWPGFPTLAHGLWRGQELTLFKRHENLISEPLLDLGGGDGIFGAAAEWPKERTNLDYDQVSLDAATRLGETIPVHGSSTDLPFGDGSFVCCVSNSVFEHLPNLPKSIQEMYRVLRPGGVLLFTMTLGNYTNHLSECISQHDALMWTGIFGHHQQPSRSEVLSQLKSAGFEVVCAKSYQPSWFSQTHRVLISPALQFIERRLPSVILARLRVKLIQGIRESLESDNDAADCACLFVVARKPLVK